MRRSELDEFTDNAVFRVQSVGRYEATQPSADQQEVLHIISSWSQALKAGDGGRLESLYSCDAVRYEARTPLRSIGADRIRLAWEKFLSQFPEGAHAETIDVNYYVSQDHAFAHFMLKFTTDESDEGNVKWLGVTHGFGTLKSGWRILHEHVSTSPTPLPDREWVICSPATGD